MTLDEPIARIEITLDRAGRIARQDEHRARVERERAALERRPVDPVVGAGGLAVELVGLLHAPRRERLGRAPHELVRFVDPFVHDRVSRNMIATRQNAGNSERFTPAAG